MLLFLCVDVVMCVVDVVLTLCAHLGQVSLVKGDLPGKMKFK